MERRTSCGRNQRPASPRHSLEQSRTRQPVRNGVSETGKRIRCALCLQSHGGRGLLFCGRQLPCGRNSAQAFRADDEAESALPRLSPSGTDCFLARSAHENFLHHPASEKRLHASLPYAGRALHLPSARNERKMPPPGGRRSDPRTETRGTRIERRSVYADSCRFQLPVRVLPMHARGRCRAIP